MTILSVDDDPSYQTSLEKMLNKVSEGRVTLYKAFTMAEALKLDAEKHPAVVLLDLILPDSAGDETLPQIKSFGSPVIVVTNTLIDSQLQLACMKAGAKRVFQKPVLNTLWSLLGQSPAESFAARLLGTAGSLHLENIYGT